MTTQIDRGSIPEKAVHRDLRRRGYQEGVDFEYQAPFDGGRVLKGGNKIDFLFLRLPLGINVQGEWWHYEQGASKIASDRLLRARMAGKSVYLIFIDESDIMRDVKYYVSEALSFRDHSQLG